MPTSLRLIPIVVLILFTLGADQVQAQAVCDDRVIVGQHMVCKDTETYDSTSTEPILINTPHITITTTDANANGITARREYFLQPTAEVDRLGWTTILEDILSRVT